MRKKLIVTIMCALLFVLCGCSEPSEPVVTPKYVEVENMIAEAHDSHDLLEARKAYYTLTNEERIKIKNAETLCLKIHEENYSTIRSAFYEAVERILKDALINPASLQLHSRYVSNMYYCDAGFIGVVEIDYSAQNGFGGYVRNKDSIALYIHTNEDKGNEFFCRGKLEAVPKVCISPFVSSNDYYFNPISKYELKEIEATPQAHKQ